MCILVVNIPELEAKNSRILEGYFHFFINIIWHFPPLVFIVHLYMKVTRYNNQGVFLCADHP